VFLENNPDGMDAIPHPLNVPSKALADVFLSNRPAGIDVIKEHPSKQYPK
jgi:hypothetical protein